MHGLGEQPCRPAQLVELGERGHAVQEQQRSGCGLEDVVADRGASGHVDDGEAERGAVVLAQVVHHAHRTGRISHGRRNAAPRRTCAHGDHRRRPGGETIEPFEARVLPPGERIFSEAHEVPAARQRLVHYRALPAHQVWGVQLSVGGHAQVLDPLPTGFHGDDAVHELDAWKAHDDPVHQVFEAWMGGARHCD